MWSLGRKARPSVHVTRPLWLRRGHQLSAHLDHAMYVPGVDGVARELVEHCVYERCSLVNAWDAVRSLHPRVASPLLSGPRVSSLRPAEHVDTNVIHGAYVLRDCTLKSISDNPIAGGGGEVEEEGLATLHTLTRRAITSVTALHTPLNPSPDQVMAMEFRRQARF